MLKMNGKTDMKIPDLENDEMKSDGPYIRSQFSKLRAFRDKSIAGLSLR